MSTSPTFRKSMTAAMAFSIAIVLLGFSLLDKQIGAENFSRTSRERVVVPNNEVPSLAAKTKMTQDEGIFAVGMTPDGHLVATGDQNSMVRLWDARTGVKTADLTGHEGDIVCLDIDRDGQRLATIGFDGIRIWRLPSGELERLLPTKRGTTSWIKFAPDGLTLASGGSAADVPIQIWDVVTGHELPQLPANSTGARCAAFSPDGRRLVAGYMNSVGTGEICFWDIPRRQLLTRSNAHRGEVRKLEFINDGQGIISADTSGQIVVWDAHSGGPFSFRLPDHEGEITAMAVTHDGALLATSSRNDRIVHVWELATGEEISRFSGHQSIVKSIVFSADGRIGVSGGFDAVVFAWELFPELRLQDATSTQISERDAELQWVELSGSHAIAAQRAIAHLANHPPLAIELVASHLQQMTQFHRNQLDVSIANLNHVDGDIRQQAIRDLEDTGDLAEIALRRTRKQISSLIYRQRLDAVLRTIQQQPCSPTKRAIVRSVQLLERIGNSDAARVLTELAQGAADDLCATVASGALRRINRRSNGATSLTVNERSAIEFGGSNTSTAKASPDAELVTRSHQKHDAASVTIDSDALAVAAEIDKLIEAGWKKADIVPAPLADDAEWIRRATLDLIGRIPLAYEVLDFVDETSPDKRSRLIERLLGSPEYVQHQVNIWRDMLLGHPVKISIFTLAKVMNLRVPMERWLETCLQDNLGYDTIVRTLLTIELPNEKENLSATDFKAYPSGPLGYYFRQDDLAPAVLAGDCSRLFLGIKLECAKCHDHPFADWKQEQFWQFAAFFSGVRSTPRDGNSTLTIEGEDPEKNSLQIPDIDKTVATRFLDGREPQRRPGISSRKLLAEWITSPENPYFARAAVNRIWAEFFGAGLAEPLDDVNDGTASGHLELLDLLARRFQEKKFDLKFLARAIVLSQAYQRTSRLTQNSQRETGTLSKMPVRSLSAEQLYESLVRASSYGQFTVPLKRNWRFFSSGMPNRAEFLRHFGELGPRTETETSMLDALFLMNGELLEILLHPRADETLSDVVNENRISVAEKIEFLYLSALSRRPRLDETERMIHYVESRTSSTERGEPFADIFWSLINSSEFMTNH